MIVAVSKVSGKQRQKWPQIRWTGNVQPVGPAEEIAVLAAAETRWALPASVADARWIPTVTGKQFNLLEPRADQVCLFDIGLALARIPRFGGHTRQPYSVAQHSVHVSRLVPQPLALAGLLHDASEAYVQDLVRPLKQLLPGYKAIEARIQAAIGERFGIETFDLPEIKLADERAVATEIRDLLIGPANEWRPLPAPDPRTIKPCACWEDAADRFFRRFAELSGDTLRPDVQAVLAMPRAKRYKGNGARHNEPFRGAKGGAA